MMAGCTLPGCACCTCIASTRCACSHCVASMTSSCGSSIVFGMGLASKCRLGSQLASAMAMAPLVTFRFQVGPSAAFAKDTDLRLRR